MSMQHSNQLDGPTNRRANVSNGIILGEFSEAALNYITRLLSFRFPHWSSTKVHQVCTHTLLFLDLKVACQDFESKSILCPTDIIDQAWRVLVLETQLYARITAFIHEYHHHHEPGDTQHRTIHYSIFEDHVNPEPRQVRIERTQVLFEGMYGAWMVSSSSTTMEAPESQSKLPQQEGGHSGGSFSLLREMLQDHNDPLPVAQVKVNDLDQNDVQSLSENPRKEDSHRPSVIPPRHDGVQFERAACAYANCTSRSIYQCLTCFAPLCLTPHNDQSKSCFQRWHQALTVIRPLEGVLKTIDPGVPTRSSESGLSNSSAIFQAANKLHQLSEAT